MPCYHPIPAYQAGPGAPVRLHPPLGTATLSLPCGTCLGCRTARALEWAHRCTHEAALWPRNCFVTLTYDDRHLPLNGHLDPEEFQRFFKRLRSHVNRYRSDIDGLGGFGVRYFACGEYGSVSDRPHYHAILFNCWFRDSYRFGKYWRSATLEKLWPWGQCIVGEVSPAVANYVAQYSLKKIGCDADGVVRPKPFLRMSLKPAIGARWLDGFSRDLSAGYLVVDGKPRKVPRTYLARLSRSDPALAESIKFRAYEHSMNAARDNAPERLAASEAIHVRRKQLVESRSL